MLAELQDQPGQYADGVPEQRAVGREVDVRLHHGGIDAELGAVLEAESDGGLDHGVIERADRGGGEASEGPVEGIVLGDRLPIERRKAPEGVAVGDALAQLAEIPVLHALEHERPQDRDGAQAAASRAGVLEPAH